MKDGTNTLSLERYQADAKALVAQAQVLADESRHAEVLPLHFLVRALERDRGVREVFKRAVVDAVEFEAAAQRALAALPQSQGPAYLSSGMLDLLERAEREAQRDRVQEVRTEHLLNALTQEIRGPAGELLGAFGLAPGSLRPHLSALRSAPRSPLLGETAVVPSSHLRSLVDEVRTRLSDPVLLRVTEVRRLVTILERRDKCHPLLVGEPGVGKAAVIRALAQRIAADDVPTNLLSARLFEIDPGALLLGARPRAEIEERGRKVLVEITQQGSVAILVVRGIEQLFSAAPGAFGLGEGLRSALLRGEVRLLGTTTPEGFKRIQERDAQLGRLLTVLPIAEPSVEETLEIVRGVAGRYESHHQIQISETAVVAAAELAKRYVHERFLPDSALDLLDEAAARKRVELDGIPAESEQLLRRFEGLKAQLGTLRGGSDATTDQKRLSLEAALQELAPQAEGVRQNLEQRRRVVAELRKLRSEVAEAQRGREQAASEKQLELAGKLEREVLPDLERRLAQTETVAQTAGLAQGPRWLTAEDVAQTLAAWTGIPVSRMLEAETEKLLKMEQRLSQRVVGQEDAVQAMARAVRRGRVGLRDPGKPIGSFLFLGPSGVGKTELAKALAQFLFDDEQALTRLDMSEFMERHMAQRLIGAPPGYADSEQGGFLTEAVRQRPYSVLLFDEVEKAHQDVFNLLLQVLDDGRLTDGRGRLADFSNTVVIMTSNIGSDRVLETEPKLFESEEGRAALREVLQDRLREFFRPEFLNRVDEVLLFRPLTREHLRKVVEMQLRAVERLLAPRRLKLEVDEAVKDQLVERGYEPALGARPVKRAVLRHIQDPLAQALLNGQFSDGMTVFVRADASGTIRFEGASGSG